MRPALLAFAAVILAACSSAPQPGTPSTAGQGVISVEVVPNPIDAELVDGERYDFPFEVVVRETGGRPVDITRVTATVYFAGSLSLGSESWDAEHIRGLGYSTSLPARGEARYRFNPRKEVPDERLFDGVSAELKVEARDDGGSSTTARTSVTVTR